MQAISTFFRTFIKSIISPAYYNDIVRAPYSFSWKYFLAFNLLGALLFGVIVGIPLSLINISGIIRQTAEVYPTDLEVNFNEQGISVNQELPYSVSLPVQWSQGAAEQVPMNLVTFINEEQATAGARVVEAYDSFAVVTPNTIYVREDEDTNEVRAYAVPEFQEPFMLDRTMVDGWVTRIADNPFFQQRWYAPVIALFIILFSYPFILLWKTVTLAFYSLLIWVITSITMRDKQLGFGKIFQVGQHSMTLVTLLAIVVNVLSFFTLGGVFYLIAFVIWTLFLISQLRSTVVQSAVMAEATASGATPRRTRRTSVVRRSAKRSKKK